MTTCAVGGHGRSLTRCPLSARPKPVQSNYACPAESCLVERQSLERKLPGGSRVCATTTARAGRAFERPLDVDCRRRCVCKFDLVPSGVRVARKRFKRVDRPPQQFMDEVAEGARVERQGLIVFGELTATPKRSARQIERIAQHEAQRGRRLHLIERRSTMTG